MLAKPATTRQQKAASGKQAPKQAVAKLRRPAATKQRKAAPKRAASELHKPTARAQRKAACPACAAAARSAKPTTCPTCGPTEELKRPPAVATKMEASGAQDPAERQADAIGARIGASLASVPSFGPGPLPDHARAAAEPHLGVSLAGTYVDAGLAGQKKARDESALAVTEGKRIAFGEGQLDTSNSEGRALIGHELVHVAQQAKASRPSVQRQEVNPEAAKIAESAIAVTGLLALEAARTFLRETSYGPRDEAVVKAAPKESAKVGATFKVVQSEYKRQQRAVTDGLPSVKADIDHLEGMSKRSTADAKRLGDDYKAYGALQNARTLPAPHDRWNDSKLEVAIRNVGKLETALKGAPAARSVRSAVAAYKRALSRFRLQKNALTRLLVKKNIWDPGLGEFQRKKKKYGYCNPKTGKMVYERCEGGYQKYMHTSEAGKAFIKASPREAFVLDYVYDDGTGACTWGYGHVDRNCVSTDPGRWKAPCRCKNRPTHVTKEEAEKQFKDDVAGVERWINERVRVPLNQNEFDALVSFAFNYGSLPPSMLKPLNECRFGAVETELGKHTKTGNPSVKLTERRQAEISEFQTSCEDARKPSR